MARAEVLVPIEDIAGRAGHGSAGIQGWASRLGIKTERDWAGRECVPESGASRIVQAVAEAGRANAALHSAHEDYCRDWERRKHEAGEEAFQRYIGESLEQQKVSIPSGFAFMGSLTSIAQPLGGAVYEQANAAAAAARADFERGEPRKSLEQFEKSFRKGRRR